MRRVAAVLVPLLGALALQGCSTTTTSTPPQPKAPKAKGTICEWSEKVVARTDQCKRSCEAHSDCPLNKMCTRGGECSVCIECSKGKRDKCSAACTPKDGVAPADSCQCGDGQSSLCNDAAAIEAAKTKACDHTTCLGLKCKGISEPDTHTDNCVQYPPFTVVSGCAVDNMNGEGHQTILRMGNCRNAMWKSTIDKGYLYFKARPDEGGIGVDGESTLMIWVNGKLEVTVPNTGDSSNDGTKYTIRMPEPSNEVVISGTSNDDLYSKHIKLSDINDCGEVKRLVEVNECKKSAQSWSGGWEQVGVLSLDKQFTIQVGLATSQEKGVEKGVSHALSVAVTGGSEETIQVTGGYEFTHSVSSSMSNGVEQSKSSASTYTLNDGIVKTHSKVQYIRDLTVDGANIWQWKFAITCSDSQNSYSAYMPEVQILSSLHGPPCCTPEGSVKVEWYGHYCKTKEHCLKAVAGKDGKQVSNAHCWIGDPTTKKHPIEDCSTLDLPAERCATSGNDLLELCPQSGR